MAEQRQHHAATHQQGRDDGQDVTGALPGFAQHRAPTRQGIGRDFLHLAGADLAMLARQQSPHDGDQDHRQRVDADHPHNAQVLAGDGQDDGRARRTGHERDEHRGDHAFPPGGGTRHCRDGRHIAAQPQQERHRDAAVQPDLVKTPVHHKGDAMHQPDLFERDQQQHQRNHVGHDDADQADEAVQNGALHHPDGGLRLPTARGLDQALRRLRVDPAADHEHHEQHPGEHRQAGEQAPLRVQQELIEPEAPAAPGLRRPHAQGGLVDGGGPVVAVGMDFFCQRPWQTFAGGFAQRPQPWHQRRKMFLQLTLDIAMP